MSTQRSHFSTVYGNTEWSAGVVERAAVPLPSVWKLVLVWEMWIEVLYSRPWPKIVLGMFSPVIIFFPFLSPPFLIWPVMWDVKTYSNLPFHSLPLTWSGPLNPAKGISCKCICGLFRAPRTCQVAANVILSCWGGSGQCSPPKSFSWIWRATNDVQNSCFVRTVGDIGDEDIIKAKTPALLKDKPSSFSKLTFISIIVDLGSCWFSNLKNKEPVFRWFIASNICAVYAFVENA